ncbi:hypothetical protein BU23DRAFT_567777 [Bimuria novae-zelandiae CBS 107.79]|uniref:Uncharacterized protein n=1 Tax=Bimuria novae-zelandiae CBS 107.79 TaxID=1447943 RepID=A0A6A5VBB4_9PLEO|nr:hypothetical protein BU23DRAFT_567777 [Bimuria novae-zelandiae CBS 107.79]
MEHECNFGLKKTVIAREHTWVCRAPARWPFIEIADRVHERILFPIGAPPAYEGSRAAADALTPQPVRPVQLDKSLKMPNSLASEASEEPVDTTKGGSRDEILPVETLYWRSVEPASECMEFYHKIGDAGPIYELARDPTEGKSSAEAVHIGSVAGTSARVCENGHYLVQAGKPGSNKQCYDDNNDPV